MNTPSQVFRQLWHQRLENPSSKLYVPGQNQRVDVAARILSPGERLLDVGCGAGMLGIAAREKFWQVYGIDLAQDALCVARDNGLITQRVDLNSESLPFQAEFFDAVTMLAVLPYVYDPYYVLQECHRVLRPGGKLLLSAVNMRSMGKLFSIFVRGWFPSASKGVTVGYDGGAMHYFCSRNLSALLDQTGFLVLRVRGIFHRPQWAEYVPAGLPVLGGLLREFLAGEIMLETARR